MQKEKVIFDDKNEALFTFNDDGLVTTIDGNYSKSAGTGRIHRLILR